MNEFVVTLLPAAENDLAALWTAAPDRARVTRADAEADRLLRQDPAGNGNPVSEGLYRLTVGPLTYFYEIDHVARTVEVTVVRATRR